ncbi:hypothetical protein MRX96_006805 [Rhipicephalus microplus]
MREPPEAASKKRAGGRRWRGALLSRPDVSARAGAARRTSHAGTLLLAIGHDRTTASCGARTVYKRPAHGHHRTLLYPAAADHRPPRSMPCLPHLSLVGPPFLRAVIGKDGLCTRRRRSSLDRRRREPSSTELRRRAPRRPRARRDPRASRDSCEWAAHHNCK